MQVLESSRERNQGCHIATCAFWALQAFILTSEQPRASRSAPLVTSQGTQQCHLPEPLPCPPLPPDV